MSDSLLKKAVLGVLGQLKERGLVEFQPGPDGKPSGVKITEEGRKIAAEIRATREAVNELHEAFIKSNAITTESAAAYEEATEQAFPEGIRVVDPEAFRDKQTRLICLKKRKFEAQASAPWRISYARCGVCNEEVIYSDSSIVPTQYVCYECAFKDYVAQTNN